MIQDAFDDDFDYGVECDGCSRKLTNPDDEKGKFVAHFQDVQKIVESKGWLVEGDSCYCPECQKTIKKYKKLDMYNDVFFSDEELIQQGKDKEAADLLKEGADFAVSKGYKARTFDKYLSTTIFAIPSIIDFYKKKGYTIKWVEPMSEFEISKADLNQKEFLDELSEITNKVKFMNDYDFDNYKKNSNVIKLIKELYANEVTDEKVDSKEKESPHDVYNIEKEPLYE
jgi:hypothetical protein